MTVFAIFIQGYHPGAQDDGVYLAAIKQDLNPHLFPHDAAFFKLQLQATIFDKLIAGSASISHLPVAWAVFLWQFGSIFLILWGCFRIAQFCFQEVYAQWAGVALVAVLLAMPVSGTALYLADENLHPRTLATAAILWAIVAVLERRWLIVWLLLAVAAVIHPIMAAFGISYCIFLTWSKRGIQPAFKRNMIALMPLGWIFEPVSPTWIQAANTRPYYFLAQWPWYEWLGVFAPLLLLWWFSRIGRRDGSRNLEKIGSSLVYYGIFQLAVAFAMMIPVKLERLRPLQPMRYLQLMYVLMLLLAGGLIGQYILRRRLYRWLLLFLPLAGGMFYAQSMLYPGTAHLELPGRKPSSNWLRAFAWIKANTPEDAYFAIDPYYLNSPGEDVHGFRALAERSVLADGVKDPAVVTQVPRLGPEWQREMAARANWKNFQIEDFERLRQEFGVTWAVVQIPAPSGLDCPYQNPQVAVCRIPASKPVFHLP